jgi:hypothetical protein
VQAAEAHKPDRGHRRRAPDPSTLDVFTHRLSHTWNLEIGEIITALLDAGMRLTALVEHDSVPWEALSGQMVVDNAGEWRLNTAPERLAASYTLQAIKA